MSVITEEKYCLLRQPCDNGGTPMAAQVNMDECTGCGVCVDTCPVEAITMNDDKALIDPEKCTECGLCVDACPSEAIAIP
jgi:formate hydrogenlyase subunit 6/NADH:ubiquinone oxidoreductase subunit I